LITEHGSLEYEEFLSFIGEKIPLKGHTGHNGGLDKRSEHPVIFFEFHGPASSSLFSSFPVLSPCPSIDDTTGTHSVYTKWRDMEVMFHVSTLLPYSTSPDDKQQVRCYFFFFFFSAFPLSNETNLLFSSFRFNENATLAMIF